MKYQGGKVRSYLRFGAVVAGWLSITGCAATTMFVPYPSKINPLISSVKEKGEIDPQSLADECRSRDALLYSLERGRLQQILGRNQSSMEDFRTALDRMREEGERATVSASELGAQAFAVMVNDNALPYRGEGYERVMLHHFQSLNYLARGDLEGAGVEIRRANAEQEAALRRHEQEAEKARRDAEAHQLAEWDPNQVLTEYAGLDEIAGRVKNSFQNAYTFYLSGIVYERLGQPNDAYIDYKKALEINPGNRYLQRDVVRLAATLGMKEDLSALNRRFKVPVIPPAGADEGELVILFEDGFAPQKEEIKIVLPLIDSKGINGAVGVAFPIYRAQPSASRLSIFDRGEALGVTEPITDFHALAAKALREKLPAMVVRQVIRSAAKAAAAKTAKEKLGALGGLGASLYNIGTENADLRSWVTLPAQAQILRATLPAGRQRLSLAAAGVGVSDEIEVEIRDRGTTVLHVVRAGHQLFTTQFPL